MPKYGIRINDRWFKEYVYHQIQIKDRYTGHTLFGTNLQEGDIVDIITTDLPERIEVPRSLGNTIALLVSIEKLEGKIIEIIPLEV